MQENAEPYLLVEFMNLLQKWTEMSWQILIGFSIPDELWEIITRPWVE